MNRFRPTLCGCALVLAVLGEARAPPRRRSPTQAPAQTPAKPPRPRQRPTRRRSSAASSRRVRRTPDAFAAHHALGEFYLQAGKLTAAIPHLERARDLDPAHYANGYDLAVAYLETGGSTPRASRSRRMLEAKETAELFNLLGDVDARAGDFVAAAVGYQRAAHLAPTEEHLFDWGDNLLRLRAYDDAVDVFTASIRRHPTSARLHIGLGIAQYSRGRHEEAVTSFCRAADLGARRPAPVRVPRRDVRRVAGTERRDHAAPGPVRRADAHRRERAVLLRDEPLAGAVHRRRPRSRAGRGAAAQGDGAGRPARQGARAARHPAVGAAPLARGDPGAAGRDRARARSGAGPLPPGAGLPAQRPGGARRRRARDLRETEGARASRRLPPVPE